MKSFSLVEIIISVIIGAIVIVALFELAFSNITTAQIIRHRLIAAHLAQEGIEIVANMRTQNWLDHCVLPPGACDTIQWRGKTSPTPCSAPDVGCLPNGTTYIAQYNSTALTADVSNPPLVVDNTTSLYCYGCSGAASPYHRQIAISTINDHQMKVVATVSWVYKGNSYSVSAEDRLYNYL